MKRTAAIALCLLANVCAFAQSAKVEGEVLNAAMKHNFDFTLPYVTGKIVLSPQTVALPAPNAAGWNDATMKDFAVRNSVSAPTASLDTFNGGSTADLSKFGAVTRFDASAFRHSFGEDACALWVARPGFADDRHAAVVMRLRLPRQRGSVILHYSLEATAAGWRVTGGGSEGLADAVHE